jgi:phosphotriesterase-related protein
MVLSHDTDVCSDFGRYKRASAGNPDEFTHTYCYVPDVVVPALRAAGVSETQIKQMTVDNPRRALAR